MSKSIRKQREVIDQTDHSIAEATVSESRWEVSKRMALDGLAAALDKHKSGSNRASIVKFLEDKTSIESPISQCITISDSVIEDHSKFEPSVQMNRFPCCVHNILEILVKAKNVAIYNRPVREVLEKTGVLWYSLSVILSTIPEPTPRRCTKGGDRYYQITHPMDVTIWELETWRYIVGVFLLCRLYQELHQGPQCTNMEHLRGVYGVTMALGTLLNVLWSSVEEIKKDIKKTQISVEGGLAMRSYIDKFTTEVPHARTSLYKRIKVEFNGLVTRKYSDDETLIDIIMQHLLEDTTNVPLTKNFCRELAVLHLPVATPIQVWNSYNTLRHSSRKISISHGKVSDHGTVDHVEKAAATEVSHNTRECTCEGISVSVFSAMGIYARNLHTYYFEPVRLDGFDRVWWSCICGERIFADIQTRDVKMFQDFIKPYSVVPCIQHPDNFAPQPKVRLLPDWVLDIFRKSPPSLPQHVSIANGSTASPAGVSQSYPLATAAPLTNPPTPGNYLFLCVGGDDKECKLKENSVHTSMLDVDFFQLLRSEYFQRNSGLRRLRLVLRKLLSIDFVKFEVDPDKDLDIICREAPDHVPPASETMYVYDRRMSPPIPAAFMMKYFRSPECLRRILTPALIKRVPKKRGLIEFDLVNGDILKPGWGLHFREGKDEFMIRAISVIVLFLAALFGVIWSVVNGSIQDGFSVSAFALTAMTMVISLIQLYFMD